MIPVLRAVHFDVRPGEVHALMGENGAGKSTLVRIMTGAHAPDPGGSIFLNGRPVVFATPQAAQDAAIASIYQELSLVENLTVAENMYLGREITRFGHHRRKEMERNAFLVLAELGAPFLPRDLVSSLTLAEKQLVEIARVMLTGARVVIMDEPTTSLSTREAEKLFAIVRRLRDRGVGVVYISHRMEEVFALADRVTVMRDGRHVGTLEKPDIEPGRIIRMMIGRELSAFHDRRPDRTSGRTMLEVEALMGPGLKAPCSFTLRHNEILGIAGLVGAGRTELARVISGISKRRSGRIRIEGADIEIHTPRDAMKAGIVYLTEDRRGLGLFLNRSVRENINMLVMEQDAFLGIQRNFTKAERRSQQAIRAFSIRLPEDGIDVGLLSGGNQQKVLLARLLQMNPKIVILDEPTRGIDVGAKASIYSIVEGLATEGVGVIVISSDLPEIIGIADRVLVIREGVIAGEVGTTLGNVISEESIMKLATQTSLTGGQKRTQDYV
ncbi:sugar ABC transporter ATP-binding protein [Mesorhizobium sp. CGMCC 1.15528]|uniref:Sugar ABC transporter ATP-binding protein n=1 Tax=Mesorhizobium zhangyense TaxID=1776730 RepID=A0A7C9VA05_9HYPH|nr:sugar ABC transporter ATP-binding protein [Mesorhizobium zhangyense]NGN44665.1 sugar ABC transporter ATP-binding protein [Mesorhizobium zhangyense]